MEFINQHKFELTLTLKYSEFCEDLYKAGKRNILSALHCRSNRPNTSGGAAVKICKYN